MITRSIKLVVRIDIKENVLTNIDIDSVYAPIDDKLNAALVLSIGNNINEYIIVPEIYK